MDKGELMDTGQPQGRWASEERGVGRWRVRVAVTCLLIPLIAASCVAGPGSQPEAIAYTESVYPPSHAQHDPSGALSVASDEPVHHPLPAPAYFHFLRGYLAELANDTPTALAEYQAALNVDPASVFLRVRLATLQFLSGVMPQAVSTLDSIPRDQVRDAGLLTQMAKIYAGAGRPDHALELYEDAIRVNPGQGAPYFDKGVLLLNLKRAAQAEEVFTRGIAHASQSHLGYFYRGKALEAQGKNARAKEDYLNAITRAERFEPAYQALAKLYEADGDIQEAIRLYERFVASGAPRDQNFRNDFVRLLLQHKQYRRALAILDQMIADDPGNVTAHIRKALAHVEMNDKPRAIADLERLLQAHPSELRVRDYLGWVYEQVDDVQKAIEAYRTNTRMDATFYDSHIHLGVLLYRLNRFDESTPHLIQAVTLNPRNPETHLLLGLSYLQVKRFERAQAAFARGVDYHPTDENLRFNLGATYDKLGRFPDVVREMEAVLTLNPNHADALNYLGYSYADRGIKGEDAVALTRRAVSLKPDNGAYVDSLGWALFKVGRVDEALRELKRAVELVNDDPVIFEHLGEIYLTQQRREKAQQAWIRSLALDPGNEKLIRRFREVGFGTPPPLSNRDRTSSDDQSRVSHYSDPVLSDAPDAKAGIGQ